MGEAEVFLKDVSFAARGRFSTRIWLRVSSWRWRGFEFQQWVCFPSLEESREEMSDLLAHLGNIILGGKVFPLTVPSPPKTSITEASITLLVFTDPWVSS